MSISTKLKTYLDQNHIKYTSIIHSQAFTAQEIAQIMHVPGKELAKTVAVKADGKMMLAVLPASYHVNLSILRDAIGAGKVELATESEFMKHFPECEIGAMPPFGNLYDLPVYVSAVLTRDHEIVFNAGTHTDAIRMKYADFERLVYPTVIEFSEATVRRIVNE
ncbi:MAG: YbaK/EbsC family protein [Acidobacteria bacterium]|nr:YbaK/EbsC family protein [Acidobacteriota bacterium]MBI3658749.1 YbaK/EbsC family protein [Acidobacteriota bacterium]